MEDTPCPLVVFSSRWHPSTYRRWLTLAHSRAFGLRKKGCPSDKIRPLNSTCFHSSKNNWFYELNSFGIVILNLISSIFFGESPSFLFVWDAALQLDLGQSHPIPGVLVDGRDSHQLWNVVMTQLFFWGLLFLQSLNYFEVNLHLVNIKR